MRSILFALLAALAMCSAAQAVDRGDSQLELAQAINAVQAAERDDAAQYAPTDLDESHAMLASAQTASDHRDWTGTAMYAERAKVSADLASARSRQHRAESATEEIERSVDSLRAQTSHGGAP
jgi:hypothetical protein